MANVLPYYHPTTAVFVDDNLDFLSNLSLQLDAQLAYRLFDAPNKALEYLESVTQSHSLSERFFATFKDDIKGVPTEPILRLDLAAIEHEVRNTQRFAETAVVLVDYAMPQMNGLELCQRITNPYTKKILFTGVADERVAVEAFNEGIIDHYIRKSARNVYEEVNTTIHKLQNSYIRETLQTINRVLSLHDHMYLSDPGFAGFFERIRQQTHCIEYYLATQPGGFLLLDGDGHMQRLIILTDDDLDLHKCSAQAHGAPSALLDALERGNCVPHFDTTPDGLYRPFCTNWHDYLYAAEAVQGRMRYYCALAPVTQTSSRDVVASYNGFLDWLDRTGYTLF